MAEYLGRIDATIMVGVGQPSISTAISCARPRWMTRSGLEWFYRLIQEPRRLWKRYLTNNPKFIAKVALQILGQRQ